MGWLDEGGEVAFQIFQFFKNSPKFENPSPLQYAYNVDYFTLCEDVKDAISACNSGISGNGSSSADESTSTTRAQQ